MSTGAYGLMTFGLGLLVGMFLRQWVRWALVLAVLLVFQAAVFADGPEVSDVVRVIGNGPIAHACPIEGGFLLTNRHVVGGADFDRIRWSDDRGNEGTAELDAISRSADLAVLRVTVGKVGHEFPAAALAPSPGDKVYLRAYRYDGRRNVLDGKRIEARVTRVIAGHVLMDEPGGPGSSGGCVLNAAGEVVAINSGGVHTTSESEYAGLAVGIWGDWLPKPEGGE